MSNIYYEIFVSDAYDAAEIGALQESAYVFGIVSVDQDDACAVSITFKDEETAELIEKLSRIANWYSQVALDESITTINRVESYNTNYKNPNLHHLLSQGTKGSC